MATATSDTSLAITESPKYNLLTRDVAQSENEVITESPKYNPLARDIANTHSENETDEEERESRRRARDCCDTCLYNVDADDSGCESLIFCCFIHSSRHTAQDTDGDSGDCCFGDPDCCSCECDDCGDCGDGCDGCDGCDCSD
ncbi:hypothetical protein Bhyg_08121 [Pseudolycoriella hygida]|uniref:Uncharacterized protein n=1 Tax=Pseudolycoriella hygida TaxID=35572 RepID=A0A9Q0S4H5_9DIPT|nr:hypothetical protein Bhyg_08121 [Pseudolycoriella hygida]